MTIDNRLHTVKLSNEKGHSLSFTFPDSHRTKHLKNVYIKKQTTNFDRWNFFRNIQTKYLFSVIFIETITIILLLKKFLG